MKTKLYYLAGSAVILFGGLAFAQPRHPNLAAAQRLCHQAFMRISDAQQANEWDMQGHAAKAKELLDQAEREIRLSAQAANRR
ncbi:MAG TPA: hypothetical protein VMB85_03425 [Bryobacteraceae bacterium]|jgi:hypothetical protein|nr:hypothetical protein [Bryobacteraceae bacterium]